MAWRCLGVDAFVRFVVLLLLVLEPSCSQCSNRKTEVGLRDKFWKRHENSGIQTSSTHSFVLQVLGMPRIILLLLASQEGVLRVSASLGCEQLAFGTKRF